MKTKNTLPRSTDTTSNLKGNNLHHPLFPRNYSLFPHLGFTLVELIVVITILVILGTIAFMSLSASSGNARDGSRVSDLANLSQALDISYTKDGSYPSPDNSFTIAYSGWALWYQGTVWDTVIALLDSAGAKMSKKPTDPLTPTKEYTYSKTAYGNSYQLKTDWEGGSVAYGDKRLEDSEQKRVFVYKEFPRFLIPRLWPLVPQASAASGNPSLTYLKGNYNGMVVKTQTGNTIYLVAVPSIVTSQTGATGSGFDVISAISNKFLVHGQTNSGGIVYIARLVYSSGSLPTTDSERILFASGIANAYSGTVLASQSNIASYISALASNNTGSLASLGGGLVSASLGGSASSTSSSSGGSGWDLVSGACTWLPVNATYYGSVTSYSLVSAPAGTSLNASGVTTPTANTCQFRCNSGYNLSGNSCAGLFIAAAGGDITTSGNYKIHTFTGVGANTFQITYVPAGATTVEVLVVAGGGGGGGNRGGGGGGGGLLYSGSYTVSVQNISITVGAGGAGGSNSQTTTPAPNGGNSVFGALTAIGGGGWGRDSAGADGGSGGGGGSNSHSVGGNATNGQGYNGGSAVSWDSGPYWPSGGGGGAGAVGTSPSGGGTIPNGGNGLQFSISGTPTYYAGGWGGGGNAVPNSSGGLGWGGGGTSTPGSGSPNTGGGGGGGSNVAGGNGGSGIVIIRYQYQ